MPSPFPGMDPWLEDSEEFSDIHDRFITYLCEALNAKLRPPYRAKSSARSWIERSERRIVPDLSVVRPFVSSRSNSGGVAVADSITVDVNPVVVRVEEEEVRETRVEIHLQKGRKRLITAIELLSPKNKTPGMRNRDEYLKKQREILDADVNLVEIDLLRKGGHVTAVPRATARAKVGQFDYHVCVRAFANPTQFQVYPIQLTQRLPSISIPILTEYGSVIVDLQPILDRTYDAGNCWTGIDYSRPASPKLSPEQTQWADERLRAAGLIPSD